MNLPETDTDLISKEESTLKETFTSLLAQQEEGLARLGAESIRARELTSELVNTRRAEDKIQLASDEAVSHRLRDMRDEDTDTIKNLIERPYFGRIMLEETTNGKQRTVEYKIGYHANTECRIIDWRKAPLSKLYYEYKEGDSFCEEIQGQEREGRIALRHTVNVVRDNLQSLSNSRGSFRKNGANWEIVSGPEMRRNAGKPNELPNVLSLITPEQFRAITEEATTAVIIQGIAGSGKTTVALHRLAWLLHSDNSPLKPAECQVLVKTQTFHRYISGSLPSIGVTGVPISSFSDWATKLLSNWSSIIGVTPLVFDPSAIPASITRLKFSPAVTAAIDEIIPDIEKTIRTELENSVQWNDLPAGARQLKENLFSTGAKPLGILIALKNSFTEALTKIPSTHPRAPQLSSTLKLFSELLQKYGKPEQYLLRALSNPSRILAQDKTKLLDADLVKNYERALSAAISAQKLGSGDEALALYILFALLGGPVNEKGKLFRYGHIVLDEAQDFASVHYSVIMASVNGPKDLTLIGDVAQRLDDGGHFPGWDELRKYWEVSAEESRFVTLSVAHRSTLPIMRLADHALGEVRTTEGRAGKAPRYLKFKRNSQAMPRMIEWLGEVRKRFPTTLTAVITGSREQAKFAYSLLEPSFGNELRLGDSENLTFDAGIAVLDAKSAKGLEFFAVLLWNPTEAEFEDTDLGRRLLYTAITRSEEHLMITTWDRPTPLLPRVDSNLVRGEDYTVDLEDPPI
jgi:DNA helicase-2/ATP-dependent DNA helicase PcrA